MTHVHFIIKFDHELRGQPRPHCPCRCRAAGLGFRAVKFKFTNVTNLAKYKIIFQLKKRCA